MKRGLFFTAVEAVVFFLLSSTAHAQISFFLPPTYAGSGNTFVADFNADGKPDLLLSDGTLNLGNGDGTFRPGTAVPGTPLAVADFNGDGKPDVLEQGTGTLLVLLGNGDGTFQPAVSTPSGASLSTIAAVDLNGDGKADVVGVFNGMLIVYLGKGDGTFGVGVAYNMGGATSTRPLLSFGDFNGDKKTDVVVSIEGGPSGAAGVEVVFLGNGDGTLQAAKTSTSASGNDFLISAPVGDFNGDGKLDLAIAGSPSCVCNGVVSVLLGNGDGTFQAAKTAFPGSGPLAAADLNGDGKLDLVLISFGIQAGTTPNTQVYLGNGDGTFSNASNYIGGVGLVVADLNLDGKLDIAAGGSVLLGNGNGTFQGIALGVVPGSGPAVVGEFNKNGAPGVALVSSNSVFVLSNNGSGALSLTHTYTLQEPGYGIVTADLNGDGNLDLMVFGTDPSNLWNYSVLLGNGDGSFKPAVFYPQNVQNTAASYSAVVGDFNGDHKLDVAVSLSTSSSSLALLLGNGDGTFAAPAYVFDGGADSLVSADFNRDGKLDIAAGGSVGTALLFGKGDGTFQTAIFPSNLSNFAAQITADVNNDGNPDLVGGLVVALGNGDGTFTVLPPSSWPPAGIDFRPGLLTVADLNGDGKPDLLLYILGRVNQPVGNAVALGNGDGTFSFPIFPFGGYFPLNLVADMNGDGRPDVIFQCCGGVAVMINNTSPSFGISASPLPSNPVVAGNSVTSTVAVIRSFGFAGVVALSCSGLPSGASCQFNPASVPGGSTTSSLMITTTMSTAAGTYYPVLVQGTSGSVTKSAFLTLNVSPAPDFTIAGTPASATVNAGQSASFNVVATSLAGLTATVSLACSITPAVTPAPTCTLSQSALSINPSAPFSAEVTVGTTAPMTVSAAPRVDIPSAKIPLMWGMLCVGLLWNRKRRLIRIALLIGLAFASMAGCGGGGSPSHTVPGTPSGTYTVTVTGTSGSLTHSAVMQVVVQ